MLLHAIEFNDLAAVETLVRRHPVAALITEPALQNIGVVKLREGYLDGLRRLADHHGFLLIFDEVKTGFRASLGGYQSIAGVAPDLSTFGKALANGFPIAALAGKLKFMDLAINSDPAKRVLVAGTYNCHPVPVAAAIACLKKLKSPGLGVYSHLEQLACRLEEGQDRLFHDAGVTATISRIGSAPLCLFHVTCPQQLVGGFDGPRFRLRRAVSARFDRAGYLSFSSANQAGKHQLLRTQLTTSIMRFRRSPKRCQCSQNSDPEFDLHLVKNQMIIDVHSHAWQFPDHFSEDFALRLGGQSRAERWILPLRTTITAPSAQVMCVPLFSAARLG